MGIETLNIHELPYPALEINKDRCIIDVNSLAKDISVTKCTNCWNTFGKLASIPEHDKIFFEKNNCAPEGGTMCMHCKADQALSKQEHTIIEEKIGDTLWEIHWIPSGDDTYIHYGIDITNETR